MTSNFCQTLLSHCFLIFLIFFLFFLLSFETGMNNYSFFCIYSKNVKLPISRRGNGEFNIFLLHSISARSRISRWLLSQPRQASVMDLP